MLTSVTFLMTDVEGSTRRWELQRDAMRAAVRRLDAIVLETVATNSGKLVKERGEGDSHFATFDREMDAVRCAIDLTRKLQSENWAPLDPIRIRCAIHSGEAEFRDGDYYGPTINRCARMRGAAHGGQVIVSEAVRDAIKNSLPPETRLVNLGEHRFKDLQQQEHIYQVVAEDLPSEFPPLNSVDPTHNNLPLQLTSFVGRAKDLQRLYHLILKHRLVTLTGAGGTGKTRLSLQSAAELTSDFKDGVWFASLVDVRDPNAIAQQLANALPLVVGANDPLEAIINEYKKSRALIVVDNCEHVVAAVSPIVSKLLAGCPSLHILATSRQALAIKGEFVFPVPTLDHDIGDAELNSENVGKLEAVSLLRDRAASKLGGKEILTGDTAGLIYELVRLLAGIPLAIEQAASNLSFLSLRDLVDRLKQHFELYPDEGEGIEERHETMRKTIEWSYEGLSAEDKDLFADFSIFDGGASLRAIESICFEDAQSARHAVPILKRLTDKSMISIEDAPWGEKRYRMLEPIREYAAGTRPQDREPALRLRHFMWHHDLAVQASEVGIDAQNGLYKHRLVTDYNNIRAGLQWAAQYPDAGCELLETCVALEQFWIRRSHLREGVYWLQIGLNSAPNAAVELRAKALNKLGGLMYRMGKWEEAERAFRASYDLWSEIRNDLKAGAAKHNLALIALQQKNHDVAKQLFLETAALFERAREEVQLAMCLQNLAVAEEIVGDLEGAAQHFSNAVALYRRNNQKSLLAQSIHNWLGVCYYQGNLASMARELHEGLELVEELGEDYAAMGMLQVASAYSAIKGKFELSAQLLGAAYKAADRSEIAPEDRNKEFVDLVEQKLTAELGTREVKRLVRFGNSLSLFEAIKIALSSVDE